MFELFPFNNGQRDLFNFFDKADRDFFGGIPNSISAFRTDIIDKEDRYVLQAELPGFSKEEININVEGDYLTISAEHKSEVEESKDNYVRKERHYGSFSRSFDVSNIKVDEISAEYKDGVLELSLPKQSIEPDKGIRKIEVK